MSEAALVVVAFACVPGRGSEPGVGWETARAAASWGMSRKCEVVVVTRSVGRLEIERACAGVDDMRKLGWLFVDLPAWLTRALGGNASRRYFAAWQLLVLARLWSRRSTIQTLHLVTYATDSVPPFALLSCRRRGARVWGPLGSSYVAWRGGPHHLRDIPKKLVLRIFAPLVGRIILQSPYVSARMPSNVRTVCVRPNVVVDDVHWTGHRMQFERQLVTVSQLVRDKRIDLAIKLVAVLSPETGLLVIGDGPERANLEELAATAGVSDRVRFVGAVARTDVLQHVGISDVLLHLSEHESAGWAVAEALSVGTPPLVFRRSGADFLVSETNTVGGIADRADIEELRAKVLHLMYAGRGAPTTRWSRANWQRDLAQFYDVAMAVE